MEIIIIFGIIFIIFIIGKIVGTFKENKEHIKRNNVYYSKLINAEKIIEEYKKENEILKSSTVEQSKWLEKQNNIQKAWLYQQAEVKRESLEEQEYLNNKWLKNQETIQLIWLKKQDEIRTKLLNEIDEIFSEREKAYKWLAPLVADAKIYLTEQTRDKNELIKSKRNKETQVRVDILLKEKKSLLEENIVLKYYLEYIKTLIPEVDDVIEYNDYYINSLEDDSPYKYLTKEEYDTLSDTEKNIRALEYYKKRKKKNWEIGRDFERYIGYLYEKEGYEVEYFGIEMKFNDLGRDLIIKNNEHIVIIQCKYWSKNKIIHEKHIAQLFGTVTKYKIDNPDKKNIFGLFISHTILSEEAKKFAKALDIAVKENVELGDYPMIKCNNGRDQWGGKTKIYHLPMDQQYDTTIINKKDGEFYAFTIEEAESKGYRRAYKWHGN